MLEFIANLSPSAMVFIGLLLIFLDLLYVNNEMLAPIGLSIMVMAIFNALLVQPVIQLWLYPIVLFTSFFLMRKLYGLLSVKKIPSEESMSDYIGMTGIVEISDYSDDGANEFYKDKEISRDKNTNASTHLGTIIKVNLDGVILPAQFYSAPLQNGERVIVKNVINETAIVEELK